MQTITAGGRVFRAYFGKALFKITFEFAVYCRTMSENEDQNTEPAVSRPPRRKVLRKRQNRDDILSYRGQMTLSFKAKQVKLQDSDSSESDNDEAFQRVQSEEYGKSESPKTRDSDSDREEEDL